MTGAKPYVDQKTFTLLEAATKVAGELAVEWMVTGAAGRVLLLEGVYGLPHGRATQDIDLGIMVESWDHYRTLIERLQGDGRFQLDSKQQQRLLFQNDGILDLVPFGGVESKDRKIQWPPDNDFVMSVMGFREAYANAADVMLDGLKVPVVSPVGLVLLKLVAWSERHGAQPGKDAADVAYVLRHFSTIMTEDVLFDEYIDDIEIAEHDLDLAASRVLGRKIALLAKQDARDFILSLLVEELLQETDSVLVREVGGHLPGATIEKAYAVLQSLRTGLIEESKK